jgi:ribosomal protein S12
VGASDDDESMDGWPLEEHDEIVKTRQTRQPPIRQSPSINFHSSRVRLVNRRDGERERERKRSGERLMELIEYMIR